jgi:hypothetical protein
MGCLDGLSKRRVTGSLHFRLLTSHQARRHHPAAPPQPCDLGSSTVARSNGFTRFFTQTVHTSNRHWPLSHTAGPWPSFAGQIVEWSSNNSSGEPRFVAVSIRQEHQHQHTERRREQTRMTEKCCGVSQDIRVIITTKTMNNSKGCSRCVSAPHGVKLTIKVQNDCSCCSRRLG